ncbi:uroporphyrinogen-III C-methyltransferase [Alteromonas facilis]|uniref:uroporphyrinogen-III C-methyltransferase n=1 Tax=Alteromonas facilis TaxID=2048004 RepID=UPI000C29087A|nr:uroporphyrinogen-III C-methyltransferase [Alteromonas facilis]
MAGSDPKSSSKALTTAPSTVGEDTESIDVSTPNESPTTVPKTGGLWFFTLINLLLILAALGAAGWYYWTVLRVDDQRIQTTLNQLNEQNTILSGIGTQQRSQASELSSLQENQMALQDNQQKAIQELLQRNTQLQEQIGQLQSQLTEIGGRRPSDWLLAEADYLVRMAGRKLWLEGDERSALMMLSAADSRLADLSDPSLIPIRQLLAEDIQSLQQINPVSPTSVALSISGMLPLIDKLPVDALKLPEPTEGQALEPLTEDVSDWWDNIKRSVRALMDNFVSVKHRDQPVEPLMSVQMQWLLKEQLSFALLQAKTAAIKAEPTLYQQSLQRAMSLLIEEFDIQSTEVQQFTQALQNLLETDISKPFPDQFKVQKPLADRLDDRIHAVFRGGEQAL